MKKTYQTPTTDTICVNVKTRLMQASVGDVAMEGFSEKLLVGGTTTSADSRRSHSLWDDEE